MNTCYVIDAVRTPIGKYGGKLSNTRPDDLLATCYKSNYLQRNSNILMYQ
jgi:acetyl-CoA acetyltransferase